MRIPRDISGNDLAKALSAYGYVVTRQAGSHIRLTTQAVGEHHVTIPNHDPLRVGTLNAVITDVAEHLKITKGQLLQRLFG
jgi:predicted RNA binding protein YcfA (HicA-like mRNA interferase family)